MSPLSPRNYKTQPANVKPSQSIGSIHRAHRFHVTPILSCWFRDSTVFHLTLGSRELSTSTVLTFTMRRNIYARIKYLAPTSWGTKHHIKSCPKSWRARPSARHQEPPVPPHAPLQRHPCSLGTTRFYVNPRPCCLPLGSSWLGRSRSCNPKPETAMEILVPSSHC